MQKSHKAWPLPSEMSVGRGAAARDTLARKYLSGVQGLGELLEEFRCLANSKRDKEYSDLGEGTSPNRNTMNSWTTSLKVWPTSQDDWILFKKRGHIQVLGDQTTGLMELLRPHTWACGWHRLKLEEKRADYLLRCDFHFWYCLHFFTNPFLSNVILATGQSFASGRGTLAT